MCDRSVPVLLFHMLIFKSTIAHDSMYLLRFILTALID